MDFDARTGEMLSLLVWFVFGAVILSVLSSSMSWRTVVYAVLALTVLRLVPVALCLWGSHLDWWSVAFIGWLSHAASSPPSCSP